MRQFADHRAAAKGSQSTAGRLVTEVLGEKFAGTGVTDDYATYDSIFTRHQLCWAHFLRKAIERLQQRF